MFAFFKELYDEEARLLAVGEGGLGRVGGGGGGHGVLLVRAGLQTGHLLSGIGVYNLEINALLKILQNVMKYLLGLDQTSMN